METNWQRFIRPWRMLRKKRKGMKAAGGKALRVLGALMLLATLFGPMPYAPLGGPTPVAEAADLAWGGIRLPLQNASNVTAPFADIAVPADNNQRAAVASDGTVFVSRVDGASAAVWRSSDGGLTWQAANSTCATGNIAIKASPKYSEDSTVVVLCSGAAAVPAVSLSRDGGATWGHGTGASITLPATVTALSFDLAPNFSGADGGMIIIGTTGVAANLAMANRWTSAGDWAAALFNVLGNVDATPMGGSSAAADGIVAVGFSPKYATDSTVLLFRCDVPGAADIEEYRVALGTTAASTGAITPDTAGGSGTITATCATTSTVRLGFPSDVESGSPTYFLLYNQDNNGVLVAPEDLYKRTGTPVAGTFSPMTPASTGTVAVTARGLAVSGTFADAQISVLEDTVNPRIYRSTNGGVSWRSGVQLDKDGGTVGAAGGLQDLALHPSYATNSTMFATTRGARGGLMKSTNGGASWMDTGLTNADHNNALVALSAPSTTIHFLVTGDGTAAGRSIWKTTTAGGSAAWQRVDRRDNVNVVKASPAFATDNTVYALATVGTTEQVLKSTDGGLSFKAATSDPGIKAMDNIVVVSATTVFAGSSDGLVYKTTDGGGTWTQSNDLGNNVYHIEISPNFATDNTVAVVAASMSSVYQVWLSTDGGATFTQKGDGTTVWGTISGAVPRPRVIFSPDFATDNYLFLAPGDSTTSDALRRIDSKGTANWASMNATNWATSTPVSGMAAFKAAGIGDGVYFIGISASAAAGTVGRTYYPKTASTTNNTKVWLNSGADAARTFSQKDGTIIFESSGTYRYIALDTAGAQEIRTWTDTAAYVKQPTLTMPLDGGTVATNTGQNGQPVVLSWTTLDRVWEWDLQIALDKDFNSPIVDTTTVTIDTACTILGVAVTVCGATAPVFLIPTGNLATGVTYYWRVRVKEVGASDAAGVRHDGSWATTRSFTVGSAGAPTAPEPSLPIEGTTLTGLGTSLSWNNPSGTTQIHVQVSPLNDDGPGINLIIGSAINNYAVLPPVFGTGNYVMLPGATYTWRVRTSTASTSIGVDDPSWGPWSDIRTFKTPKPNAGTIQLLSPIGGATTTAKKPVLTWKDSNAAMFYYEVQLSSDPNFGTGPQGAIAAVQHQLVHGAVASPPDSYTSPVDLAAGTYYWRVRQRMQATALGPDEPGIAWTASQSFKVQ